MQVSLYFAIFNIINHKTLHFLFLQYIILTMFIHYYVNLNLFTISLKLILTLQTTSVKLKYVHIFTLKVVIYSFNSNHTING